MYSRQRNLSLLALCLITACSGDPSSRAESTHDAEPTHDHTTDPSSSPITPDAAPGEVDASIDHEHQGGTPVDASMSTPDASTMGPMGSLGDVSKLTRGSRDALSVPLASDLNPDPKIIEIKLHASVAKVDIGSKKVEMYTFNGQVPGPRIEANVGDRLIVHFTNHLPVATMIHWHGVRVPNAMDGTPLVQPDVLPGASFDYAFDLTDPGIYWYHPHLDSAVQLMKGLYAPLIVRAPDEPKELGDEVTLVLSDVSVSSAGVARFPEEGAAAQADGRDGSTILINGKEPRSLLAQPGARLRFRVLNAAANRYFRLGLEGHKLTRVGSEAGLSATATESYYLLVANAERADVVVVPRGKAGDKLKLSAASYDRGTGAPADASTLLTISLVGDEVVAPPLPARLREIEPLSDQGATDVTVKIERMENHYMVNGVAHEAPPIVGHVGETQRWHVANITYLDHPLHIHGFFFQVLDPATNRPKAPLEWRDTVNIPQSGQLELLVKYDNRPGKWMYHCHILDHVEVGLMGLLNVVAE